MSSKSAAIDEFLARLDADEVRARARHCERQQRSAEALCRRIRQALVDLDLGHLQEWVQPTDGAVSFGDLEPQATERLAQLLEGLAEQAR